MRKYLSCLIICLGLAFSGLAAAAYDPAPSAYTMTIIADDLKGAAVLLDTHTEAMAASSAAESTRAALVARMSSSDATGPAVPYDSPSKGHAMALRHYQPASTAFIPGTYVLKSNDPGDENDGSGEDHFAAADPEDNGDATDDGHRNTA